MSGTDPMRILITGSNSGFGRLTSLTLARQGHHVIATMRSLDKGAALREAATAEGLAIELRELDVCDPDSVASAVSDPAEIDALVNNAGFEVQGAIEMIDDDLMHRQLDTNVLGPLRLIRAVMPSWRARGHGVVVNVSSVVGRATSPFGGA
ncbi:MAG: SDR family NAD(P)-dependent oxidoreductase, partial [Ilumatobacteraceae bacterium]